MTREELTAYALDGMIAEALARAPDMIRARGFSEEELPDRLEIVRADLAAWRQERLLALVAYFDRREAAPLN